MNRGDPIMRNILSGWGLSVLMFAASVLVASPPASAQAAPLSPTDPTSTDDADAAEQGLTAREVVILLQDAYRDTLSERDLFDSTLPNFVLRRRTTAEGTRRDLPSPAGVITLAAPPGEVPASVTVRLDLRGGRFFSAWPSTLLRGQEVVWEDLHTGDDAGKPPALGEDHWLMPLRSADRLVLDAGRRADRFLLYDLELSYPVPFDVDRKAGGYIARHSTPRAALDVALLRRQNDGEAGKEGGWEVVAEPLQPEPAARGTGDPEAFQAPTTYTVEQGDTMQSIAQKLYGDQSAWSDLWNLNRNVAPQGPNRLQVGVELKLPDNREVLATGRKAVTLEFDAKPVEMTPLGTEGRGGEGGEGLAADADAAASRVVDRWAVLGLGEPELAVARRVLAQHLRDQEGAVIVYRLPRAELDLRLPVTITPEPTRHARLGMVILINADPDLADRIEDLIESLGDESWAQREAAQRALEGMGDAAAAKLEAAVKSSDAEIAHRADLILTGWKASKR